jgi:N-acetylglutamate synthase-like GNAT family acetyltransferase
MVTIRPSLLGDLPHLEALLRQASLATGEHTRELLDNPDCMAVSAETLSGALVAEADGRIVGFCTVLPLSEEMAEIDALFVHPAAWRRGIGKALMLEAERLAALSGLARLGVVSSQHARPFYEAFGFEPSGIAQTRFGPAHRLVKHILPGDAPTPPRR